MGKVVRHINNDSARHQKAAFDGWQQCSGGRVVAMFRWRGCLAGKWSKDRLIPVSIRLGVVCVLQIVCYNLFFIFTKIDRSHTVKLQDAMSGDCHFH